MVLFTEAGLPGGVVGPGIRVRRQGSRRRTGPEVGVLGAVKACRGRVESSIPESGALF